LIYFCITSEITTKLPRLLQSCFFEKANPSINVLNPSEFRLLYSLMHVSYSFMFVTTQVFLCIKTSYAGSNTPVETIKIVPPGRETTPSEFGSAPRLLKMHSAHRAGTTRRSRVWCRWNKNSISINVIPPGSPGLFRAFQCLVAKPSLWIVSPGTFLEFEKHHHSWRF
jgi:hypothetical protein